MDTSEGNVNLSRMPLDKYILRPAPFFFFFLLRHQAADMRTVVYKTEPFTGKDQVVVPL